MVENNLNQQLFTAITEENIQKAGDLLDRGADINAVNDDGETVLTFAVKQKSLQAVKFLIAVGADMEKRNQKGRTALLESAGADEIKKFRQHIADIHFDDMKTEARANVMFLSAWKKNLDILHTLIACGADVNAQDYEGNTPLHLAAENDHTDIFRILLDAHANPYALNHLHETPGDMALRVAGKICPNDLKGGIVRLCMENGFLSEGNKTFLSHIVSDELKSYGNGR